MPPLRSALILLGAAAVFWSCAGREDTPALPDAHAAPAVAAPPAWAVGQRPTAMLLVGYAAFVAHLGPDVSDGLRGGGWIGSYGPDGQLTDTLIAGLDAPRALAAVRDVLYVLDGNRVLGVRTDDGTPAATVDLSGVTLALTALCPAPDGTLFVVSEQAGRVWRVDPGAGAVVPIATLASVSGVDFDAKAERLYLSTSASGTGAGQLYTMAADESTPAPLGGLRGRFLCAGPPRRTACTPPYVPAGRRRTTYCR